MLPVLVCTRKGHSPINTWNINHYIDHVTAQLIGLHVDRWAARKMIKPWVTVQSFRIKQDVNNRWKSIIDENRWQSISITRLILIIDDKSITKIFVIIDWHRLSIFRVFVWGRRPDVSSGLFPFHVRYFDFNIWGTYYYYFIIIICFYLSISWI